jgi:pyruvate/2-oxoglutarate dehydrogenase complex dihydrolipoamide acyltransferase (E2) component
VILTFVGGWLLMNGEIAKLKGPKKPAPAQTVETPKPTPAPTTQPVWRQPEGTDAVHPAMRDFVRQAAREYGISEEEARKALRKGSLQGGYSKEEVEKVFGK